MASQASIVAPSRMILGHGIDLFCIVAREAVFEAFRWMRYGRDL
jgi:hypothetical protein